MENHAIGEREPDGQVELQKETAKEVVTVVSLVGTAEVKGVWVKLEVQNNTDQPFEFCKYQTPFEESLTSGMVFLVLGVDGKELEYQGAMVKRAPPSHENGDYMTLEPGKSASASNDIASSYKFKTGEYRIKFLGNDMNMLPGSYEILFSLQ